VGDDTLTTTRNYHREIVEERDRLRTELEWMTKDRDEWKRLAERVRLDLHENRRKHHSP